MSTTSIQNSSAFDLRYLALRTVSSPEDQEAGRKRYCGVVKANEILGLGSEANVRGFLGLDEDGKKRKATLVNLAIEDTLENKRDLFPVLNSGIVMVAKSANVNDDNKTARLIGASIINGAQTRGVLEKYFKEHPEDQNFPSVNFELIVTDDEGLIGDISIARNYQNRVTDLSIFGRKGLLDSLELEMQKHDPKLSLRKTETNFGDEFLDSEKLIQVITALTPKDIGLPSAERNKKTPETIYRVYAYRHRSRCLKDFADVMDAPNKWPVAYKMYLEIAWDAWALYQRLKSEQFFSSLKCVKGIEKAGGAKVVAPDGVPDGIVFPMLSALSRFIRETKGGWKLDIPKTFPWHTFFAQARIQETNTAHFNPQTMGKSADCYIALHGAVDMFFAMTQPK